MKQEFLDFLNALMEASPDIVEKMKTDNIEAYINALKGQKNDKPALTENGRIVLNFLQENQDVQIWKARDVAERLGINSRSISGAFRKLVTDGFCEKIEGSQPVNYILTEKGKNYNEE